MAKGDCRKGMACGFCHEVHETCTKLDKRQRLALKCMSAVDRHELLLPHIRRRLAHAGLMVRASPLLFLLQSMRAEHLTLARNTGDLAVHGQNSRQHQAVAEAGEDDDSSEMERKEASAERDRECVSASA